MCTPISVIRKYNRQKMKAKQMAQYGWIGKVVAYIHKIVLCSTKGRR